MASAKLQSVCAALILGGFVFPAIQSPAFGQGPMTYVIAPSEDTVVRRVSFADLNLASVQSDMRLNVRVAAAIEDLCTEATDGFGRDAAVNARMIRCTGLAWAEARPQIAQAIARAHEVAAVGSSALPAASVIAISVR